MSSGSGWIGAAIAVALTAACAIYALATKPNCPAGETAVNSRWGGWYCGVRQ